MSQINSTISLKPEAGNQMLYATQLYGSFFGVYGSFSTEDCKTHYEINSLYLSVIMYKGLLNIGITKAEMFSENEKFGLKIEVQAAPNFDITQPVKVKIKNKSICPKNGGTLDILRVVKKIHERTLDFECHGVLKNIFDEEFYYREGENHMEEKEPSPGTWDNPKLEIGWIGSERCPKAHFKLI